MSDVTHSELVEHAACWLRRLCATVITEMATAGTETPDAIGWSGGNSILVECKVSLSDFRADAKKHFRYCPEMGIGVRRYYCAPKGLLKPESLPEKWGLLEWDGKRMRKVKESEVFPEVNRRHEIDILISTLRRIAQNAPKGVSIRCYTIETQNRATVGVEAREYSAPSGLDGSQVNQNPGRCPGLVNGAPAVLGCNGADTAAPFITQLEISSNS